MALIFEKHHNGKQYEVRSAGLARRLYTDGVFHTQVHPQRFFTANVWDCLSLTSLFLAPTQVRRVLVLGVGGGAVIRQIGQLFPQAQFVGVELDKVHLQLARRFFGLASRRITLLHADALEWVAQYRGPKFDLIIEDLFTEAKRQPERVRVADRSWFVQLSRHLTRRGALVFNFISPREMQRCSFFQDRASRSEFNSVCRFTLQVYENAVGIFMRHTATLADWHTHLARHPAVLREFSQHKHKYRLRKLA